MIPFVRSGQDDLCVRRFGIMPMFLAGFIMSGCATSPESTMPREVIEGDHLFEVCRSELAALPATRIIKVKLPDSRALIQRNLTDPRHLEPQEKSAILEYMAKRKSCWTAHLIRKGQGLKEKAQHLLYKPFEALRDQNTAALYEDKITVGQYNKNRQRINAAYRQDLQDLEARLAKSRGESADTDAIAAQVLASGTLQQIQQDMDIDRIIDGY